jgi:hypothetical protein
MIIIPRKQRAQGKPGTPRAPAASYVKNRKHTSVVTTGSPVAPGLPCAMVLTGSFVLSPEIGLYCLRRPLRSVSFF